MPDMIFQCSCGRSGKISHLALGLCNGHNGHSCIILHSYMLCTLAVEVYEMTLCISAPSEVKNEHICASTHHIKVVLSLKEGAKDAADLDHPRTYLHCEKT